MKQRGAQIPIFLARVLQDTEHLKYYTQTQCQNAFPVLFLELRILMYVQKVG